MNKVTGVQANDDFSLDLQFNDGSVKRFDAKPYLDYEIFRELKDLKYFKQVDIASARSNGHMSKTLVRKLYISRAFQFRGTATAMLNSDLSLLFKSRRDEIFIEIENSQLLSPFMGDRTFRS